MGSLTLNVGDQKGGSEAVLRAAGELRNLDYKIKWSTFTSGPPLLEAVSASRGLADGDGVVNGLAFQVAAPTALKDKKKAAAIKDCLDMPRRAQDWVYDHPEAWAKVWPKDTGLPYEGALASVKRTNASRSPWPSTNRSSPPSSRSRTPSPA